MGLPKSADPRKTPLPMDLTNPMIRLCIGGARAEFERRPEDAHALYRQAWEASRDDYEACIAAHYLARFQDSLEAARRWNLEALARADAVGDHQVSVFYPSLCLNLGRAYEILGDQAEARRCYDLAAGLWIEHSEDWLNRRGTEVQDG